MVAYHLVVLVHGIWGNSAHMGYLALQIEQHSRCSSPDEQLVVYRTCSHSGYLTYDGVDVNGKRISDEILAEVAALSQTGTVAKFSLIGYSMGGLMARYALGVLYHEGLFDAVQPVHFVTFCTPHLGIVNPSTLLLLRLFNAVAPLVLGRTGLHMFYKDAGVVGGKRHFPLLQWMADPASTFHRALALFAHRTLYANTINDRRTSWYTTSISATDPFYLMVNELLSAYALEYVAGYAPTVIDFARPIEFRRVRRPANVFSLRRALFKCVAWLKVVASLVVVAPVYAVYLLGNGLWQHAKSLRRQSAFSRESASGLQALYANADAGSYGSLGERVRDQTDLFMDSVFSAVNSASYYDYHHSITRKGRAKAEREKSGEETPLVSDSDGLMPVVNLKGKVADFRLKLTASQEVLAALLNTLKWDKFPVIIRNTKATHAAVIYRHADPQLEEGKLVVRHFVHEVFKI